MKKGVVYLIGAGPGDPGLITLKGKEILESCDALVYDHLASKEFLSWVPSRCKTCRKTGRLPLYETGSDQ